MDFPKHPSRRLFITTSLSANLILMTSGRAGFAQSEKEFAFAVEEGRTTSNYLFETATSTKFPMDPATIDDLGSNDLNVRKSISVAAVGLTDQQLIEYVNEDQRHIAEAMLENEVRLVSEPDDVRALSVERAQDRECPDIIFLIWDIILGALGVEEIGYPLIKAFMEIPEIQDNLDALAEALRTGDSDRLVRTVIALFETIFSEGALRAIKRKLEAKILRRFLAAAAARCIPFVGWGILAVSIAFSVHKHWDEIACQIED